MTGSSILEDKDLILGEIESLRHEASVRNIQKFKAAKMVQRYVRGHIVREHMKHLNKSATIIQKYFKGFKTRMEFHGVLTHEVGGYKDQMSTIIQKMWRGYLSRKDKFNYGGLCCWLEQVKTEKSRVEQKLNQFRIETEETYARCKQQYWDYIRGRLHYLLRTKSIPGVFSDIHSNELSQLEQCLKNAKYFPCTREKENSWKQTKIQQERREILLHDKVNKHNLKAKWKALSTMPPLLDEIPRCVLGEYQKKRKESTKVIYKRTDKTSTWLIRKNGNDDHIWRERVRLLEKPRTMCRSEHTK